MFDKAVKKYCRGRYEEASEELKKVLNDILGREKAEVMIDELSVGPCNGEVCLHATVDMRPEWKEIYRYVNIADDELETLMKALKEFCVALGQGIWHRCTLRPVDGKLGISCYINRALACRISKEE